MLHLISENKGGRNFKINGETELNWRSLFKNSEDSLTSSVFGLLFYLPVELMWEIISEACYDDVLPKTTGKLLKYDFWPRWNSEDGNYKEPDIFVNFEQFNLIIEAKRRDDNQQRQEQWKDEIDAYKFANPGLNNPESNKKTYLLAIGGIEENNKGWTEISDVIIVRCRWLLLLKQIISHLKLLQKSTSISITNALANIFSDLVLSFGIHGYVTGELLETLPTTYKIRDSLGTLLKYTFHVEFVWDNVPANLLDINIGNIDILK